MCQGCNHAPKLLNITPDKSLDLSAPLRSIIMLPGNLMEHVAQQIERPLAVVNLCAIYPFVQRLLNTMNYTHSGERWVGPGERKMSTPPLSQVLTHSCEERQAARKLLTGTGPGGLSRGAGVPRSQGGFAEEAREVNT